MTSLGLRVAVALVAACSATAAQSQTVTLGNDQGCAVHLKRKMTVEPTRMVLLDGNKLMFYETACDVVSYGKTSGHVTSLTGRCQDYEGTYKFTWTFRSNGKGGYDFATPDREFSTVLNACR